MVIMYCPALRLNRRDGKVAVLVALLLPTVLIPILALGVDGGFLMEDRRRLQAAVDAAALAAAVQLYKDNPNYYSTSTPPPATSGATDAALEILDKHGFASGSCEYRTINLPANSSNTRIHGKSGTIEVVVKYLRPRAFSRLWGSSDLGVTARAVARVRNFARGDGIIALEDTEDRALWAHGNGQLVVNGAGVVVNSSSSIAARTDGAVPVLAATSFDVTGGSSGDRFFNTPYPSAGAATPYTGSVPVPDPLRDLPEPNPTDYPVQSVPKSKGKGGSDTITLQPGRYTSQLSFSGTTSVVLSPGIYYLEQGIKLTGQVQLTGNEVMIFNIGSGNNNIDLSGQGNWSLTPPLTGTYQGISLYQSRNTASQETVNHLSGNGGSGVQGTIYMPTIRVKLTGNGTQTLGSQFIARTLEMGGNGNFTVDYTAPRATQRPVIELVE